MTFLRERLLAARGAAERLRPLAVVLALAVVFRLPALVNAGAVDSDAAVAGLQASHMLHGEWSPRLWGAGYQGSLDCLLAALSFAVFGVRPLALFAVPFVGLLVMVALAFDLLERHVGKVAAALSVMPLVFAPMASNLPMFVVMRQSLATTLVLSLWLADRATSSARPRLWLGLAAGALALGLYIDVFALVVLPAAVLFVVACGRGELPLERVLVTKAAVRAAAIGLAIVALALVLGIVPAERIGSKARLFAETCLPWALGTKVFMKGEDLRTELWTAPLPILAVQAIGASLFALSILSAGPLAFARSIPWAVRRLGLFAFLVTLSTVAAFLVSSKPVDMWSSRYLAPIFWASPLSLAPLAHAAGSRMLAVIQAPYWLTALVGGWLSYGIYVAGPLPRLHPRAAGVEEQALAAELRRSGIHHAEAQYWLAYRLTFLWHEDPVVVPIEPTEDRYPAYRRATAAAPVRALIFHPSVPLARAEPYVAALEAKGERFERREIAGFTVLVVHAPGLLSRPHEDVGPR
jgi:hypothetical protein